ncbi:hypothetical protein [Streptomyces sp. NBC_00057]|uniref:hypothetical protein n=1 Tax=Streptomyces sp. NBC_00057 TaxID=2975634 RepID=UPI00324A4C94
MTATSVAGELGLRKRGSVANEVSTRAPISSWAAALDSPFDAVAICSLEPAA